MICSSSSVSVDRCRSRRTTRSLIDAGSSRVVASTSSSSRRSRPSSSSERSKAAAQSGFPPVVSRSAVSVGPGAAPSSRHASAAMSSGVSGSSCSVRALAAARSSSSRTASARQRRRPSRHDDEQRRERQPSHHRRDRHEARAVGPVDVFGHQQHRRLGARRLHEVDDLLDDPVVDVADRLCRRHGAVAGQERADRRLARVGRPPRQTQCRGDDAERPCALEGMRLAAVGGPLHGRVPARRGAAPARVLPMPASPAITSAEARPSSSARRAATATASSASLPTSVSADATLKPCARQERNPPVGSVREGLMGGVARRGERPLMVELRTPARAGRRSGSAGSRPGT